MRCKERERERTKENRATKARYFYGLMTRSKVEKEKKEAKMKRFTTKGEIRKEKAAKGKRKELKSC